MNRDNQVVYNPGDLVRMRTDDLVLGKEGWEHKPEEHFAIVVEEPGEGFKGQVPVRSANHVDLIWWVRPWQLELMQRGGQ